MHEMWAIATDDPRHLSVTWLHSANTAKWIEVLLGLETLGAPRNNVLETSPNYRYGFDAAFATLHGPLVVIIITVLGKLQIFFAFSALILLVMHHCSIWPAAVALKLQCLLFMTNLWTAEANMRIC